MHYNYSALLLFSPNYKLLREEATFAVLGSSCTTDRPRCKSDSLASDAKTQEFEPMRMSIELPDETARIRWGCTLGFTVGTTSIDDELGSYYSSSDSSSSLS